MQQLLYKFKLSKTNKLIATIEFNNFNFIFLGSHLSFLSDFFYDDNTEKRTKYIILLIKITNPLHSILYFRNHILNKQ